MPVRTPKRYEPEELSLQYVPLSEIAKWDRNPKKHDEKAIDDSIDRFGYVLPMVRDDRTGKLVAGHGRLDALVRKKDAGAEPPRRIKLRKRDGEWLAPVVCGVTFASEAEAEAYLLADNRLVELGGWDAKLISDIFGELDEGLQTVTGWTDEEIERLLARETFRTGEPPPPRKPRAPRPFTGIDGVTVHLGDAKEVLPQIADSTIDALVTDPPSGIAFMGEDWDKDKGGRDPWISWLTSILRECYRAMKPGAHALVWALPRTSHWTATAVEDAGFEVRDVIVHLYGQGFPKSLDASKAIVDRLGAKRPVAGVRKDGVGNTDSSLHKKKGVARSRSTEFVETAAATSEAKEWDGWGTALKPSSEHWILARKPLDGTLAANLEKWGVGALDIDGARIGDEIREAQEIKTGASRGSWNPSSCGLRKDYVSRGAAGRWPGNVVLSHGPTCSEDRCAEGCPIRELEAGAAGASKFFYVPKPSPKEKNEGLDGFEKGMATFPGAPDTRTGHVTVQANLHPTVKPVALMRHLVRLITPPKGIVLDPFAGSGTTGIACLAEGVRFVGIEQEAKFRDIAVARMKAAADQK